MSNLNKTAYSDDEKANSSYQPAISEDEISLFDLCLVLAHRKWMVVGGLLLGTSIAVLVALSTPENYRFYTTIILGQLTTTNGGETKIIPLESPAVALAKLKDGYFPLISEQAAINNTHIKNHKLQATNPKGSNLLIIETIGPLQNSDIYLQLISNSAQALIQDHNRILAPEKARLEAQIKRAKLELETKKDDRIFNAEVNTLKQQIDTTKHHMSALQDQRKIIDEGLTHIDIENKLAKKQHQDTDIMLKTALTNQAATLKQSNNPTTVLTMLALSNEIQNYQDRIATLDHRLNISLPEKQANLEKQLRSNTREQQQQANIINSYKVELEKLHIDHKKQLNIQVLAIEELESQTSGMQPTQVLRPAGKSITPEGSGKTANIAVGLLIGLLLGVFTAFAAEFITKAHKHALRN